MSGADLCAACGMCCNGVLFHSVLLQPADSPRELTSLGLKLRRKRGQISFRQPCSAFCGNSCSIYDQRPTRCRAFACRQLQEMEGNKLPASVALERVREAKDRAAQVARLLGQMGDRKEKRDLALRYEFVCAQPPEAETALVREHLVTAMRELEGFLQKHFRVEPSPVPENA